MKIAKWVAYLNFREMMKNFLDGVLTNKVFDALLSIGGGCLGFIIGTLFGCLIAFLLPSHAHANLVKPAYQTCGSGKICVEEFQRTCITKKPAKAVYKKKVKKPVKQTLIPIAVEPPCVIVNDIYQITEIIAPAPLNKLPSYIPDNRITRPQSNSSFNGYAPVFLFGSGFAYGVTKEVIVHHYIDVATTPAPPIATPAPGSFWLLLTGLVLFVKKGFEA